MSRIPKRGDAWFVECPGIEAVDGWLYMGPNSLVVRVMMVDVDDDLARALDMAMTAVLIEGKALGVEPVLGFYPAEMEAN